MNGNAYSMCIPTPTTPPPPLSYICICCAWRDEIIAILESLYMSKAGRKNEMLDTLKSWVNAESLAEWT